MNKIITTLMFLFCTTAFGSGLDCLSKVVFHESRGEPFIGKVAVANVVVNRALQTNKRICSVVTEPNQFTGFSLNTETNNQTKLAAMIALLTPIDVTFGSTYFHTVKTKPIWRKRFRKTVAYKHHIFYKEA